MDVGRRVPAIDRQGIAALGRQACNQPGHKAELLPAAGGWRLVLRQAPGNQVRRWMSFHECAS